MGSFGIVSFGCSPSLCYGPRAILAFLALERISYLVLYVVLQVIFAFSFGNQLKGTSTLHKSNSAAMIMSFSKPSYKTTEICECEMYLTLQSGLEVAFAE